ncbi:MAG TPA: amino acid adenylation domain-containing protein, partial [Longimicrobium sp.]
GALRLRGGLDPAILERALARIVRRHEALRTRFTAVDGAPVQLIDPPAPVRLGLEDLSHLPESGRDAAVHAMATADARAPFDLAAGPLLRCTLARIADDEHALFFAMHHVVSDGWSMGVLVRELTELYTAEAEGRAPALADLPVQYADYAVWQRARLAGGVMEAQLGYWRQALEDLPALELPTDRPRPAAQTYRGGRVRMELDAGVSEAVRGLARREGATVFMTLVAALQLLLSRLSGQEDFAVGSPIAGRTRRETEGLIGFFLNNLVLRADLSGDPTFRRLLARVRETTLAAFAHDDVPFEKLIEELKPPRDPSRTPFFQVLANQLPAEAAGPLRLGQVTAELLEPAEPEAKFDLTLYLADADELVLVLVYNADLFDDTTARRMLDSFSVLLAAGVAAPDRRVSTLPLFTAEERARLAAGADALRPAQPFEPFPDDALQRSIGARFVEVARRAPDAVAVETDAHRWTYGELAGRANQAAHALLTACGADAGRVALFLDHDAPMLTGILGALLAGKTYVPLDAGFPEERIRRILADVEPQALLTEAAHAETVRALAGNLPVLVREEIEAAESADPVPLEVAPETPAYILYTSGSTGEPKGVVQVHRNVLHHIRTYANRLHVAPSDRLSLFSGYGFDAAVMDIYAALLTGATLCPIPMRGEAAADLPAAVLRRGVTVFHSTPTVYRHLAAQLGGGHDLSRIRLVVLGGEETVPHDLETFRRHFRPDALFVNGMGPTECTVALQFWADGDTVLPRGAMPVGHPVEGVEVRLLNAAGEPVEVYATGEVTLRSAHVAPGYWRRPELTAAAFLPDPEGGEGRIYRTGDIGRLLPDGAIAFAGRRDGQVKIRGFRIETGEIESVLRAHQSVAECAVVAREDAPGEKRLVAYVVGDADPAALRAHVRARLPEYMAPAAFVRVHRLPLTPNGKLDRRALPAPSTREDAAEHVPPRTPDEEAVAGLFADVLKAADVGAHDDFFARGGHSLLATRLVSRVRDALGVELPLRAVFEAPTVAALAARVDELRRAGGAGQAPPLVPVGRDGALPLSFAQQRLWFLDQLAPGNAAYHLPYPLRLRGALDAAALERALGELVRRHETLRTRFPTVDGDPVQVVDAPAPVHIGRFDFSARPPAEREAAARALVSAEAVKPFDLAAGPLLRCALARLADDEHVLLFTLHHIVSDGWSTGNLVREVSELYGAFAEGRDPRLADLPIQYADFAAWQRGWLAGEVLDGQIAWWRERLAGAPPLLEVPTDRPRSSSVTDRGGSVPLALPAETAEGLRALSRREGATLFMTLMAAWQLLLSRYSRQEDVCVGTPIAGRTRLETEGLIGFFVNTLVLRTDLSGDPSFRGLLARVREATLGAYQHQDVPFEKLVEELAPERSMSHTPFFQAMFVLQNNERQALHLGSLQAEALAPAELPARFDLTLLMGDDGQGPLGGSLSYRADLFDRATAERMMEHFRTLLRAVAADPDAPLSQVELMGDAERARVLGEWRGRPADHPRDTTVHAFFARQAARTPDAVALVCGAAALTYGELDARANRLANHLRRRDVRPESRVGICLERGPDLVVALLAVLEAGGAYVPLDPVYPRERLGYMIADADVRFVLTSTELADRLPDGAEVVRLDAVRDVLAAEPAGAPESGVGAENLSHVIFTSGSTGRPKGVMIRHASVVTLLHWLREIVSDEERASLLGSTSVSFDVSVAEIFGALCWGGTLVLVENALDLPTVADRDIRYASMVPTAAAELLRSGGIPSSVRTLNLAGEALPNDLAQALYGLETVVKVGNVYGPTEDTTYSTYSLVERGADRVLIGRPKTGSRAYVLDEKLRPVPVGVPGELFLAGGGVARGYARQPALTAERFLPDPYGPPGARMYRVMDLARWTEDGQLEYLGRTDFQVKVRGFRIELG